jgi:hypothetical protein
MIENDFEIKPLKLHQAKPLVTTTVENALICESQSNQRRPNLTWDLGFAFIYQMVPVNNRMNYGVYVRVS